MGEYLRETEKRLAARAGTPGRLQREGVTAIVVMLAGLGVCLLVVGMVRLSVAGTIGGLVTLVSAGLWCLSNRVADNPASRATRVFRDLPEVKFAALSIVSMLVGVACWLLGMVKGW